MLQITDTVTLDGAPLDMAALRGLLAAPLAVALPDGAIARLAEGRVVLEQAMAAGQSIYGTTTGVGAMKYTQHCDADSVIRFNNGLALAHQVAVGEPVEAGIARLTMALRLNTAATGRVGVTPDFARFLQAMLNANLLPVLNARGSVGCGDLGQMGQLAAVMTGHGEVMLDGAILPAAQGLHQCGLAPYRLQPREGLAAVGTNAFGLARSAAAVIRAADAMRQMMTQSAVTATAWGLDRAVWQAAHHSLLPSEVAMAGWLQTALDDQADWPARTSVHDALSGRFLVQVLANGIVAVSEAARSVMRHTGQVDDNPVIADGALVTSGASLLTDLSARLSMLQLSMAQLGRNLFNRCLMLSNGALSGLPVNLVPPGAIGTGYGPLMKLAQDQTVRMTAAASPVSLLNLTMAAGLEDEALLIPLTAERLEEQVVALEWLLAIEALLSVQALEMRGLTAGRICAWQTGLVRRHFDAFDGDVPISAALSALRATLAAPQARAEAQALAPFLPFDPDLAMPRRAPGRAYPGSTGADAIAAHQGTIQ